MFGKDHQTNAPIYDRICQILGGTAPEHFVYELFLDEKGQKISKSKGNGLTIDEWLTYASPESLALYMFQSPRTAKKLHFDVIPKAVDEYFNFLARYAQQDWKLPFRQPGLSHPCRQPAGCGHAGELHHAPQPRLRLQHGRTRACCGAS